MYFMVVEEFGEPFADDLLTKELFMRATVTIRP